MPVRWEGDKAEKEGYLKPAQTCRDNAARTDDVPRLADMTGKAIDLLKENPDGKDNGFFLQVEGASIDKEDHAANPCGQIGETVDLDEAVQKALDFAQQDGETLVLVTADHAHTSQIVAPMSEDDITEMAADAGISVAEARASVYPGHTGTQLRIAGYGPGAANVTGLTDQTDLHFTVADALGL